MPPLLLRLSAVLIHPWALSVDVGDGVPLAGRLCNEKGIGSEIGL